MLSAYVIGHIYGKESYDEIDLYQKSFRLKRIRYSVQSLCIRKYICHLFATDIPKKKISITNRVQSLLFITILEETIFDITFLRKKEELFVIHRYFRCIDWIYDANSIPNNSWICIWFVWFSVTLNWICNDFVLYEFFFCCYAILYA